MPLGKNLGFVGETIFTLANLMFRLLLQSAKTESSKFTPVTQINVTVGSEMYRRALGSTVDFIDSILCVK